MRAAASATERRFCSCGGDSISKASCQAKLSGQLNIMKRRVQLVLVLLALGGACVPLQNSDSGPITHLAFTGPLIASRTTMVTAWEFPKNPLMDPDLDDSRLSNDIRWGFRLFTNTPTEAPQFTPGKISCSNCHLNAG